MILYVMSIDQITLRDCLWTYIRLSYYVMEYATFYQAVKIFIYYSLNNKLLKFRLHLRWIFFN